MKDIYIIPSIRVIGADDQEFILAASGGPGEPEQQNTPYVIDEDKTPTLVPPDGLEFGSNNIFGSTEDKKLEIEW